MTTDMLVAYHGTDYDSRSQFYNLDIYTRQFRAALVHLGHLAYDAAGATVRIPDHELAEQFRDTIEPGG